MKREGAYVCPKCGGNLNVSVQGFSSGRKNGVEVLFKCDVADKASQDCDFEIVASLSFSVEGEILWPSQEYIYNLFRPEYEQAFVLSKILGQYPEISGPYLCEEDAQKQMHYLLYKFPESYCREFKNVHDHRTKLWVLQLSQIPAWVWEHMKKVMSQEPWVDFRPQDITTEAIREKFFLTPLEVRHCKRLPNRF